MLDNSYEELQDQTRRARKRRIAQIVVSIPAALFLLIALRGIAADYRTIRDVEHRFSLRTAIAEASVVALHPGYSLRAHAAFPYGTIAFVTDSGQTVSFDGRLDESDKIGTKIPIRYDPNDPQNHAIAGPLFGFSDLVWDNVGAVTAALYLGWVVYLLRRLPIR